MESSGCFGRAFADKIVIIIIEEPARKHVEFPAIKMTDGQNFSKGLAKPFFSGYNKKKGDEIVAKVQEKKQFKRQALLDAAYELFLEQGLAKTSISDIASRANVAKGTFYLYFADKGAILQVLLGRVSEKLLEEACTAAEALGDVSFADKVLAVADYIIEYLRRETLVLRLIQRNLEWPSVSHMEEGGEPLSLVRRVMEFGKGCPEVEGRTEREIYHRIAALVSMCVSVCYSCIIEEKPDTIDNMKPVLYDIIRSSL